MDLYLQMGYGMLEHAKLLIERWQGGTAILSPRDMTLKQMEKLCKEIKKVDGNVLVDPQFYLPRADHEKLTTHPFWPHEFETNAFFSGSGLDNMLKIIWEQYNQKLNTKYFIIPGIFSSKIDNDWRYLNDLFLTACQKIPIQMPTLATLCLSSDILRSEDKVHEILETVEAWEVSGFYIVPQHPDNSYLVEDVIWLANLLELCAGLKNLSKKVVVGYANHQLLCLAASKVDAIASGTYMNVRMFPLDKFRTPEEDKHMRKSTWYYCPQSLSEYQITFLDMAQRGGVLNLLQTDGSFGSDFADILFSGAQPTSVKFSEREAFRHYLQCLKVQAERATRSSFNETMDGLLMQLETSGQLMKRFREKGVRGKSRDFFEVMDINISALDFFRDARGFLFSKKWDAL